MPSPALAFNFFDGAGEIDVDDVVIELMKD